MKSLLGRQILFFASFCLVSLASVAALAGNGDSLNSLGSEETLLDKANPTVPANTYRVVQKRVIDLDDRFEFDLLGGGVAGGDSYYNTQNLGLIGEFHFNRHWSIGLRETWNFNSLTAEGDSRFASSQAANYTIPIPQLDYPVSTTLATVSYYPFYGKMSIFDSSVSYFDIYFLGGGGIANLSMGPTDVYTGGVGMAMWWTHHFSTRLEALYQNYNDHFGRTIQDTNIGFSIGFLL